MNLQMLEEMGIQPPHSIEAEQAVLGACILDGKPVLEVAMEFIESDEYYYRPSHRTIWRTILELDQGEPIDAVTITAHLGEEVILIGGVAYLANLSNAVPTSANVDHYAGIVKEYAIKRNLFFASLETAAAAASEESGKVIDMADRLFRDISGQQQKKQSFTKMNVVMENTFSHIEWLVSNKGAITGIASGYPDLDKLTAGFQKSDLIILAARPAVGKTACAINFAQHIAIRLKKGVAIISMEMPKEQLGMRMLCAEANVDASKMRSGALDEDDWPKLTMVAGVLAEAPIYIDDTSDNTVTNIRMKCRRLKEQHPDLEVIIIDYLQLIIGSSGSGANRQQDVSDISRQLKLMARELNVAVIALSQLSRSVEQRANKRPMLSDLRESGAIEQDADIVMFLYRDDYYDPETEKKNIIEVIIAKQRSGPTGTAELVFLKNFNKFVSLERAPGAA